MLKCDVPLDVLLRVDFDDQFGVETVERGVRSVRKGADGVGELTGLRDEGRNFLHEGLVATVVEAMTVNVLVHALLDLWCVQSGRNGGICVASKMEKSQETLKSTSSVSRSPLYFPPSNDY